MRTLTYLCALCFPQAAPLVPNPKEQRSSLQVGNLKCMNSIWLCPTKVAVGRLRYGEPMFPETSALTEEEIQALPEGVNWDQPVMFLWLQGLVDRSFQRELPQILLPHELSIPEFSTLSVLRTMPGLSNAELARRSLVTPQSMNEVIVRLERRGLIERRNHPDHGRILMIEITEAGQKLTTGALADVGAFERSLLDGIAEDDLDLAKQVLKTVLARLLSRSS